MPHKQSFTINFDRKCIRTVCRRDELRGLSELDFWSEINDYELGHPSSIYEHYRGAA